MTPGKLNMVCPQGATFSKVFKLYDADDNPIILTDFTADMQARKDYSSKTVLFQITTNPDDGIVIVDNEITVTIPYAETELFRPGKYVWDIEITSPDGKRDRVLEGEFTVTPGITR